MVPKNENHEGKGQSPTLLCSGPVFKQQISSQFHHSRRAMASWSGKHWRHRGFSRNRSAKFLSLAEAYFRMENQIPGWFSYHHRFKVFLFITTEGSIWSGRSGWVPITWQKPIAQVEGDSIPEKRVRKRSCISREKSCWKAGQNNSTGPENGYNNLALNIEVPHFRRKINHSSLS